MFLMSSYQSYEYVALESTIADARKKSKKVGLGVRLLTNLEASIEVSNRLYVPV